LAGHFHYPCAIDGTLSTFPGFMVGTSEASHPFHLREFFMASYLSRFVAPFITGAASLLLGVFACSPQSTLAGGAPKKKDTNYLNHLKQLEARFRAWDTNNDNSLDKFELARAFRGPQAKPYDQVTVTIVTPPPQVPTPPTQPAKTTATKKTIKSFVLALVSLPQPGLPIQLAAAQMLTDDPTKTPTGGTTPVPVVPIIPADPTKTKLPAYGNLPDYQFLLAVNNNKEGNISFQTFDAYARQLAKLLDRHDDAAKELKQAEAKFAKATNPKTKQAAQIAMQKSSAEWQQADAQLAAIPPAIRQALKLKN
jgi:hypothetical protein